MAIRMIVRIKVAHNKFLDEWYGKWKCVQRAHKYRWISYIRHHSHTIRHNQFESIRNMHHVHAIAQYCESRLGAKGGRVSERATNSTPSTEQKLINPLCTLYVICCL